MGGGREARREGGGREKPRGKRGEKQRHRENERQGNRPKEREEGKREEKKGRRERLDQDRRGRGEKEKEGRRGKEESQREEKEAGTESQPAGELRARNAGRGAEARPGGRGEGRRRAGRRGPGPRGQIPGSRATSRGSAGRPGPRLASCPRPQHPRPARAEGPPVSPAPARRPPGAASSRGVFTGSRAGARRLRAGPATGSASRGELGGVGIPGAGRGTYDAHVGKDRWMQVSPEARCWGRGRRAPGDPRTRSPPPAPTGEPLAPITLAPHSRLSGPGPLGLTPSLSHSVRPGRPCSQPGLSTRAPAGPRGGGGWGLGRAAQPPRGAGSAFLRRPHQGCPALGVHCLCRGRPGPAALCPWGPPFQQLPRALGRD